MTAAERYSLGVKVGDSVTVRRTLYGAVKGEYTGTVVKVTKTAFTVEYDGTSKRFMLDGREHGNPHSWNGGEIFGAYRV